MSQPVAVFGMALLAVLAGASFVMQSTVNAALRASLGSPYWAAFVSYAGGTLVMAAVLIAVREPLVSAATARATPFLGWTGGLWGAVYVVIIILLVRRMGAAQVLALFVLGQMVASLVFDHFALVGLTRRPVDFSRLLGAALVAAGAALVRR
ncbi:MAG TPA: DMT family transporter [Myxococcales bacterium]